MCGRFSLDIHLDSLIDRYNAITNIEEFNPREEIFPTDLSPVVINGGKIEVKKLKWGFMPSFAKRPLINARGETVDIKPTFQYSFYNQRCLIPATGFFEWEKAESKKIKRKISLNNERIFSMAGLYNVFKDNNGIEYYAFTIITTEANQEMKTIHDRMPVILNREKEKLWLNNNIKAPLILKDLLKPYEGILLIE